MSKKKKLIDRFLGMPTDFHYDEMVKLLGYFGFAEVKKGKTSGLFRKRGRSPHHASQATSKRDHETIPNETGQGNIGIMNKGLRVSQLPL